VLDLTAAYPGSYHRGSALWACALFDWSIGEYERAEAEITESLLIKLRWLPGDEFGLALVTEAMAAIVGARGDHQWTATFLGFADALWHTLDADRAAHFDMERMHIACEREARTHLGQDRFEHAYERGRAMSPEQLQAHVSGQRQTPPTKSELTVREAEIARLVAEGLTNRQIAERLVLSPRTVEGHVDKLLAKLGVHRRSDIANWLARQPQAG
jgi:DNA-binding CsgD family transcriptional regulator